MTAEEADSPALAALSPGRVLLFAWLWVAVLTGLAWFWFSGLHARSVFIGGLIANLSFLLLKRDLLKLMAGPLAAVKPLFFIRYYLRLSVVAVALFLLVKLRLVHIPALLTGLSTVLLGIGIAVVTAARKFYSSEKAGKG